MKLYPLKFQPLFQYRMWGGEKLKTILKKNYSGENIGESWELSAVEKNETVVANGFLKGNTIKELISEYKSDLMGASVYEKFGDEFPLLIKFIDAETPLSIQVHPNNEIARTRHNSFGKNEMWYVIQAEENAELIVGFDTELDKNSYKEHLNNNTILNVMHHEKVKKGDTFYIPTGRVHAIGSGVLLAEIQQTSDITYRIYDYNRVDQHTGMKRELHNDLAIDVVDFKCQDDYKTHYNLSINESNKLVHSPYFITNIINLKGSMSKDYSEIDSFIIYICVEGEVALNYMDVNYSLTKGETILLPASVELISLKSSKAALIEVYM